MRHIQSSQRLLLLTITLLVNACTQALQPHSNVVTKTSFAGVLPSQAGEMVVVQGHYMRWSGHCLGNAPVSKSDWMLQNDSGCLYIHGSLPTVTVNTIVAVQGRVAITADQRPYLIADRVITR